MPAGGRTAVEDPSPKVAGIIGMPVTHSLSPVIHNAGYAATGLDWVYAPFPVPPGEVRAAVAGMRSLGIRGLNVTMPHKVSVMDHVDDVAEEAERAGAVNTILRTGDRLVGTNTDGAGFLRFLERDAGWAPAGRHAVVLGAGGAARAVAVALARAGASVSVAARRPEAAAATASLAGAEPLPWTAEAVTKALAEGGLVVNATPETDDLPVAVEALGAGVVVADLIYAPPVTPLLERARIAGAPAFNGVGMLLNQAALSFEIWTGVPAPLDAMSAALVRALRTH